MIFDLSTPFPNFFEKGKPVKSACRRGGRQALFSRNRAGLHQLDDCHLSSVAPAGAGAGHSGIAAVAVSILGSDLLEQLLGHVFLGDEGQSAAVGRQVALLAQGDHLLDHGLNFLGTIEGGFHLAVLQQIGNLLTQQGLSLCAGLAQLTSAKHVGRENVYPVSLRAIGAVHLDA